MLAIDWVHQARSRAFRDLGSYRARVEQVKFGPFRYDRKSALPQSAQPLPAAMKLSSSNRPALYGDIRQVLGQWPTSLPSHPQSVASPKIWGVAWRPTPASLGAMTCRFESSFGAALRDACIWGRHYVRGKHEASWRSRAILG